MEIRIINTAREKEYKEDRVKLVFKKQITVSREVLSETLLLLVAEVLNVNVTVASQPETVCLKNQIFKYGSCQCLIYF